MATTWRFKPFAVLPLALLLSVGFNLTELTVTYLLRAIHCERAQAAPGPTITVPGPDACRLPGVVRAYSRDLAAYQTINTVFSILASGVYGKLSDTAGRRRVMALAGACTAVGNAWLGLTGTLGPVPGSMRAVKSALSIAFEC